MVSKETEVRHKYQKVCQTVRWWKSVLFAIKVLKNAKNKTLSDSSVGTKFRKVIIFLSSKIIFEFLQILYTKAIYYLFQLEFWIIFLPWCYHPPVCVWYCRSIQLLSRPSSRVSDLQFLRHHRLKEWFFMFRANKKMWTIIKTVR